MTTAAATSTLTEARLVVGVDGGRSVIREIRSAAPLGLRELKSERGTVRVALVQTAATLVAGDDLILAIQVEDGASLLLREVSATLAHPVRGDSCIRQRLVLRLGRGARLGLLEEPLILAGGTRLRRSTAVDMATTAAMVHREVVVLGRAGEDVGEASLRTRVKVAGSPVLDETIDTGDEATLRSPAVLGAARVVGTLSAFGARLPSAVPRDAAALGGPGLVLRQVAPRCTDLRLLGTEEEWLEGMLGAGAEE